MDECSMYLPTTDPDKFLGGDHPPVDMFTRFFGYPKIPVTSTNRSIYLSWMIPTSFITVNPEISLCWISLNKNPVKIDWLLKYQYLNKESYLGYFDDAGMPVITFDDGHSELYTVTLRDDDVAEKDIIQKTQPHNLIKKDRRSGTFVIMEIKPQPQLDEVYFMGAHIQYKEHSRVTEPTGRKRTHKRRWYDDDPYY